MTILFFIDLDGVVNISAGPNPTWKHSLEHTEPHLIESLNNFFRELSSKANFHLVMSSSWREDFEDALEQLEKGGFKFNHKFIGATTFEKSKDGVFRGEEIAAWLRDHPAYDTYFCIDDDIEQICAEHINLIPRRHCVKTDPSVGFTKQTSQKIFQRIEAEAKRLHKEASKAMAEATIAKIA